MNVALPKPWSIERFLAWAERQDTRYEFDGEQPVAMTGGTARHDAITGNINTALRIRLRGTPCSNHGPNLGMRTVGGKIRYPDGLITCTRFPDTDHLAPDVVVVFEVVSPGSDRLDRIEKVTEYAEVPSIRRYVVVGSESLGLQVFHRANAGDAWFAHTLTRDGVLQLPEIGIEVPVSEIYEAVGTPS